MKVNITYSVSLEEIREKMSDLGLGAIEPLHGHLKILTEALTLHRKKQIPTKSFMDMLDTFRTTLATIDSYLQEVSQLTKGLLEVDNAVESALNQPTAQQQPAPSPSPEYSEMVKKSADLEEEIKTKIEQVRQRASQ